MKRLHIHIGVDNLDQGIDFYNVLFSSTPIKVKSDYAKWELSDPQLNFAISTRAKQKGIDHLGIQVDKTDELTALRQQLALSGLATEHNGETECCYARSDKSWLQDPSGIAWEVYNTMDDAEIFSAAQNTSDDACCTPETKGTPGCCEPSPKTTGCCE